MLAKLMQHKTAIGAGFSAIFGWSVISGCPPLAGQDVAALLHVSCGQLGVAIGMLGSFLVGSGVIKSDQFYKDKNAKEEALQVMPAHTLAEFQNLEDTKQEAAKRQQSIVQGTLIIKEAISKAAANSGKTD